MTAVVPDERLCVRGLGVDIVIEFDDAIIADRVRDAWRDAICEPTDAGDRTVTVSFDHGADVYSPDIDEILHNLSPAVSSRPPNQSEILGSHAMRTVISRPHDRRHGHHRRAAAAPGHRRGRRRAGH